MALFLFFTCFLPLLFRKNTKNMSCKTCFSCFSCFLLFSYLKNERKIFRIFELFAQISRLWPSPVSMISLRITDAENLRRVRELLRGKFSRSRRSRRCTRIFCVAKRCADSDENAAPPLAIIWHTSRDLCSARSRNSRKFCNNFANFWLFLRGKFARSRC